MVFLICDTKVRHELVGSEYNIRRETCAAAADKMAKPSLRDASIHDLESMCHANKLQMKQKNLTVETLMKFPTNFLSLETHNEFIEVSSTFFFFTI